MSTESLNESQEYTKDAEAADNKTPMTFPDGGTEAWMVALGASGVLFCTFRYASAFGIYQDYYIRQV